MSTFRLVAAAATLLAVTAPAAAQQVISEPGYCAQFCPYANCQNKGNPYTGSYQRNVQNDGMLTGGPIVPAKRSRKPPTRLQ